MKRTARCEIRRIAITALTLWGFGPGSAAADDPLPVLDIASASERDPGPLALGGVTEPSHWLAAHNFHFAKKSGFGYTRHLKLGERSFSFGVRGPVMPKQKALGLAFRIRF
jgi:hypothetical protein